MEKDFFERLILSTAIIVRKGSGNREISYMICPNENMRVQGQNLILKSQNKGQEFVKFRDHP